MAADPSYLTIDTSYDLLSRIKDFLAGLGYVDTSEEFSTKSFKHPVLVFEHNKDPIKAVYLEIERALGSNPEKDSGLRYRLGVLGGNPLREISECVMRLEEEASGINALSA
ncbi:MAG TPA: hypothetical protein VJI75_01340 [Candidatus Nanoarchaeia archaeon]|nr:hypothetical protein [Candidatus Nanoarchaeia archaeon]